MKKIILSILSLFFCLVVSAQQKGSYIYVGGGIGATGFQYNVVDGKDKLGLGYSGNVGYSYFFHRNWGLGTGIQISSYSASGSLTDHTVSLYDRVDEVGDVHRKDIHLENWNENQKALFFEIPLMLQYQYKGKMQRHGFYSNLGVKIQLPLSSTYEVTSGEVREGYYDQWHVLLYELPQHGFGESDKTTSGKLDFKTSVAATAEIGFLFGLNEVVDFYVGAYCGYGFTTLNKRDDTKDVIYIDSYDEEVYQSMLKSKITDNANTLAFGGKLGVRFRPEGKSKPVESVVQTAIPEVVPIQDTIEAIQKEEPKQEEPKQVEPKQEPIIVVQPEPVKIEETKEEITPSEPTKKEAEILFRPIYDYPNSIDDIPAEQKAQIDRNIEIMKKYPDLKIILEGHTCDLGGDDFNMKLGLQRAEKAKAYMVLKGISPLRIKTTSKGKTENIIPNTNEATRKLNRRVVFLRDEAGK